MPASVWPNEVLAAILESSEDCHRWNCARRQNRAVEPGAEELYGYAADEVTGHFLTSLMPLYEVAALEETLSAARAGTLRTCENVERIRKHGLKLSVAVRRAVLRNDRGEVTGILECGRRQGRTGQEMAADSQSRLLADQMPVILWATDQNLRITSN